MTQTVRTLALVLALSLLSGCSVESLINRPPPPQIYLLRPKLGASVGPRVSWALSIGEPSAPFSLSSRRIAIQRSADTLDFYADAAWQDRTPELLQRLTLEGFEDSGRISAVAREDSGLHTDYLLQIDLRRFEARYGGAQDAPVAEVAMTARLIRLSDRKVVATTVIHTTAPAQANSIPAAVSAFDAATGKAVQQLVAWTLAAPGS
ncbi:MAG: membrane integrity-associated transporter subunit PqiC [Alphaproteobacteria bacterium]|nr:membrane integrity-associated transporter subunit PqiC [Alphaproteobacteria bacterium]